MAKHLKFLAHRGNADYQILEAQRSFTRAGLSPVYNTTTTPVQFVSRVLAKAGLMRRIATLSSTAYLVPIMNLSEGRLFPYCYFAEPVVYCWDCWPRRWPEWEAFFRRHRVNVAMFSARQNAEHFRESNPSMESIWMPEAVEPTDYRSEKPLCDRSIDVLELGRKYSTYHEKIRGPLAAAKRTHRYERVRGEMIFAAHDDMLAGLGDAKISVCFPSSITHPERSGHVETVTHRYFESMASRNILLGHAPAELIDLFGYNPVVEADMNDPVGQIESILSDVDSYTEIVDRNHRRLLEVATWDLRAKQIVALLKERGYGDG